MDNKNTQTTEMKEQTLLGTLLYCNQVIQDLRESFALKKIMKEKKLFENCDQYKFSFLNLVSRSTGEGIIKLNEDCKQFIDDNNVIKMNEHDNAYAYLMKVRSFLNGYELQVQQSLNESLEIHYPEHRSLGGGRLIDNPGNRVQVSMQNPTGNIMTPVTNIDSFKRELDMYIMELERMNDTGNYNAQVLRIKTLAHKPLFVYGFNIMKSLAFQTEISQKFGLNNVNLLAILFNMLDSSILFVYRTAIIKYSIKLDGFERVTIASSYDDNTYMTAINQSITFKLLVLYQNMTGARYVTNVYGDEMLRANIDKLKNLIIKR